MLVFRLAFWHGRHANSGMDFATELGLRIVVDNHKQRAGWPDLESRVATLSKACREFVDRERTHVCLRIESFRDKVARGNLERFLRRCPKIQTIFVTTSTALGPREVRVIVDACPNIQELMAAVDCRAFRLVTNRFSHLHVCVPAFVGSMRYEVGACACLNSLYISVDNPALYDRVREVVQACFNLSHLSIHAREGYIQNLPVIMNMSKVTTLRLYGLLRVSRGTCPSVANLYFDGALEERERAAVLPCFPNVQCVQAPSSSLRISSGVVSMVATIECLTLDASTSSFLPRLRNLDVRTISSITSATRLSAAAPNLANLCITGEIRKLNDVTCFLLCPDIIESIFRQLRTYTVVSDTAIVVGNLQCIQKLSLACVAVVFLGGQYPSLKVLHVTTASIDCSKVISMASLEMLSVCDKLDSTKDLLDLVSKSPLLKTVSFLGMPMARVQSACTAVCNSWGLLPPLLARSGDNLHVTLHRVVQGDRAVVSYIYVSS